MEYLEYKKKRIQEDKELREQEKQYNKRLMDKYINDRRTEQLNKKKAFHDKKMQEVIKKNNEEIKKI